MNWGRLSALLLGLIFLVILLPFPGWERFFIAPLILGMGVWARWMWGRSQCWRSLRHGVALVAGVGVVLVGLIVVGGLTYPPGQSPADEIREQLRENEQVRERYESDFYKPPPDAVPPPPPDPDPPVIRLLWVMESTRVVRT